MKWSDIEFFRSEEFDSPDKPGSGILMNLDFVKILDLIRKDVGRPLKITSGYRTAIHNSNVGGRSSSAHLKGDAADIYCDNAGFRWDLIVSALKNGIKRVEIAEKHIHLDYSKLLVQNIIDYTSNA